MSFQAYIDKPTAQTGKTPDDFWALANEKGLVKHDYGCRGERERRGTGSRVRTRCMPDPEQAGRLCHRDAARRTGGTAWWAN